jgi:hypothetical protein
MKDHLFFVVVDVDKIQEFVFEAARLKHIVGGSVLIAYLTSRKFCTEKGVLNEKDEITDLDRLEGQNWMEIYFGGGNMKLLFAEKEPAEKFLRDYQLQFSKTVETAAFTSIIYKIDTSDTPRFEKGLEEAELKLKRRKLGKNKISNNFANPVFTLCSFCKKRNAEKSVKLPNPDNENKEEPACRECHNKEKTHDGLKKGKFENTIMGQFISRYTQKNDEFMDEFDDLKEAEVSFLGIVTIDGNRFGEKIRELVREKIRDAPTENRVKEYIVNLNKISNRIKQATLDAMTQTLDDFKYKLIGKKQKILFKPIIMGGDDICFVMDGKRVMPFTLDLIAALEKEYRKHDLDVKFAAGVSIAKPNFPFFVAHQLSESLTGNVKKGDREYSGIDFEVVFTTSVENLEQMRNNKYRYIDKIDGKTYITTLKPYYIGYFDNKSKDKAKDFNTTLSIAKGLKKRELLARNKVKQMRTLVRKGKIESQYEFKRMIARMSKTDRDAIWNRLLRIYPKREEIWIDIDKRCHNNFIDLSELSEFYPD